ncbi:MAG TPA: hypothetical protein VFX68_00305 [Sulfuricurvum sp.]|nr:hypothetical protein [Sulfuricurvum sp.]
MKRLAYALYVFILVVVLIPKEKLYFTFEQVLSQKNIFISDESFENRLLYLNIQTPTLMIDNLKIASIDNIRVSPWIFFNRITISSVSFSPLYRPFFPGTVDEITLTYSLWHPLSVQIYSEGDFGHCSGSFDLVDQKMRVVFSPLPQLRRYALLVSKLHHEKEGLVYESNF